MAPSAPDAEQVWNDRPPKMPLNADSTAISTLPSWSEKSSSGTGVSVNASATGCCGIASNAARRCDGSSDQLVSPWVDWVEGGIEFFGCDGNTSKSILGRTLTLSHRAAEATPAAKRRTRTSPEGYTKLHDDFIEMLFQEQWTERLGPNRDTSGSSLDMDDESTGVPLNRISSTSAVPTNGASGSSSDSSSSVASAPAASSTPSYKRRLPLKFKKSSHSKSSPKIAPIDAYQQMYSPHGKPPMIIKQKTVIASSITPAPRSLSDVESIVHPKCKIQKDKGKGEPVGTSISADGQANCLSKLREKIKLLVQVAMDGPSSLGSSSGSASSNNSAPKNKSKRKNMSTAGMKRRPAKLSEDAPLYTETRSMIELRLGFVSMQYGLLLRWDRDDKIIFMVLRKMCHDSFYKKIKPILRSQSGTIQEEEKENKTGVEPPPLVVRNVMGDQAIYQRIQGTEVVLVDIPHRIPQPQAFQPSVLSAKVNRIVGLPKEQNWTISLTFDGQTEITELVWQDGQFCPTRVETMEWEISPVTSFDLAGLEIRIFEQVTIPKRRRKLGMKTPKASCSRIYSSLTMPLGGLVAQPAMAQATTWELTIPANDTVSITLSLVHQSDYAHWLYKELDARRQEEVTSYVWNAPFRKTLVRDVHDDDDEEYGDLWDWLCGICGIEDEHIYPPNKESKKTIANSPYQ